MIECLNPIKKELNMVEQYIQQLLGTEKSPLRPVYYHLLQGRGKCLRSALFLLAARFGLGYNSLQFISMAAAMEVLHLATLVHDDVIDSGQMRRGKATINHIFGNDLAILTGDDLFAKAFLIFAQQKNPVAVQTMARVVVAICSGETEQILNVYNIQMDEEKYLERVSRKTASFFAASCYLGSQMAASEEKIANALQQYGFNLGMAFQISDDYLDLAGEEEHMGKTLGNDLQQGIMTLPIIYALKNSSQKERLAEIVKTKLEGEESFSEAFTIVVQSGALNYCHQIAGNYLQQALTNLSFLPDNRDKEYLRKLIGFVEERFSRGQYAQALT